MMELFYEKKDFFQLKVILLFAFTVTFISLSPHCSTSSVHSSNKFCSQELEKLGPKEKGVISQAVKDIVQSLVDDGMVDTEKIGTSVYFWAFPR